jgi:hypothetical protein
MSLDDDLRELWVGEPDHGASGAAEELLDLVRRKSARFERMLVTRNLVECLAAVLVAAFFARYALSGAPNVVARIGAFIAAGSAVVIIVHLVRHGRSPAPLDPGQDLATYTAAMLAQYDHQIRLLKSAKYWYLLPMYVGLLVASAGNFVERARLGLFGWRDLGGPAIYTIVFGAVWWLNEIAGVRRLRCERSRLVSVTGVGTDLSGSSR